MRQLLCVLACLVSLIPAYAAPLDDWQAEEDKLLGDSPVVISDLMDEVQGFSRGEFQELLQDFYDSANEYYYANNLANALPLYEMDLYLARYLGDRIWISQLLLDIGLVHQQQGRYAKALVFYEAYHAEALRNQDRYAEGFALNCIGMAHDYLGNYNQALESYGRSLAIMDELGNAEMQGILFNNIGLAHDNLSQYSEALEYYQRSLDLKTAAGDRYSQALTLSNIGVVYRNLGQNHKSLEYLEDSLAISEEIDDLDGQIVTLSNIGTVLRQLGQYEQALVYQSQSLELAREQNDLVSVSIALSNIGLIQNLTGQYQEALSTFQQSQDITAAIDNPVAYATLLSNIGALYQNLHLFPDALAYFDQSLELFREVGYQAGISSLLSNIGSVYHCTGELDRALEYYELSLQAAAEVGERSDQATALSNIGAVYSEQGDFPQARDYFNQALQITSDMGDMRARNLALSNIGTTYDSEGDYELALDYYFRALESQRELGHTGEIGNTLNNIGATYTDSGQLENARGYFSECFEMALSEARQFTWETGFKGGLMAELDRAAANLVATQVLLGHNSEAFDTLQTAKGLPLLQMLAQAQYQPDDPGIRKAFADYRNANAAAQQLREQLRTTSGGQAGQRAELLAAINEHQAQSADAWQYLVEHVPELKRAIGEDGLTVARLQAKFLKPGQLLLDYLVTSHEIIVFCVPKSGELVISYTPRPDLGDLTLGDWIERRVELLYSNVPQVSSQAASALYDLLIEPVEQVIGLQTQLIICPDRELFLVPFEAIGADGILLDSHSLTYSTSASMLDLVHAPGGTTGSLVAGVSFGAGAAAGTAAGRASPLLGNLPALPGVLSETAVVAELLGVAPLLDEQVTEETLREIMPGHRIIHLATHGFLSDVPLTNGIVMYVPESAVASGSSRIIAPSDEDDLPRSALLLPGGDDPLELRGTAGEQAYTADGFLTMAEVMGIPLDGCELVTLSACSSAEGSLSPGEGVMGLTQGFIYAGARSVLASLTKVDDTATRELMVEFYRNWTGGLSKPDALRAAKQHLINNGYDSPQYWAPFVLYGAE